MTGRPSCSTRVMWSRSARCAGRPQSSPVQVGVRTWISRFSPLGMNRSFESMPMTASSIGSVSTGSSIGCAG